MEAVELLMNLNFVGPGGQFAETLAVEIKILRKSMVCWLEKGPGGRTIFVERYNVLHNKSSFSKCHSNLDACEWLALVKKTVRIH